MNLKLDIDSALKDVRSNDGRKIVIFLTVGVVLAVSLLSCATYIGLMGNVFPDGLLRWLCYAGALANLLLMVVLLFGKFNWFSPGLHEYASWAVTGVEVAICALNLITAYQLGHGGVTGVLTYWLAIAPASPVFSMVGAIILIMTSSDMERKHKEMLVKQKMSDAEQALELQQRMAQIKIKSTYVDYVSEGMSKHLRSEAILKVIADHSEQLVLEALSSVSGLSTTPLQIAPPREVTGSLEKVSLAQTSELPKSIDTDPSQEAVKGGVNKTPKKL